MFLPKNYKFQKFPRTIYIAWINENIIKFKFYTPTDHFVKTVMFYQSVFLEGDLSLHDAFFSPWRIVEEGR